MQKPLNLQALGFVNPGQIFLLTIPAPAVGIQVLVKTPASLCLEILAIRGNLSTTGAGTDRIPTFTAIALGQILCSCPIPSSFGLLSDKAFTFGVGMTQTDDLFANATAPMPRMILPPETTLQIQSVNNNAGDSYGPTCFLCLAYPL